MSAHRFFLTGATDCSPGDVIAGLALSAADLHHARDVLRIEPGEAIECVEPDGSIARFAVEGFEPQGMVVRLESRRSPAEEPRLVLFQGVAKGDKMDTIVRQAVEVGASRIVLVTFERCTVKLDERKRVDRAGRWSRIAESAAKQAHRTTIPEVCVPLAPGDIAAELASCATAIVLWEDESGLTIEEALQGADSAGGVALVIGPEGGLTAGEVEFLRGAGCVSASLGPSILRTETAAVVALALAASSLRQAG